MRSGIILFFSLLSFTVTAQVMWQIKRDTVIKWYYFDGDEFNGPSPDLEKWIPAYSYSNVNYRFDYLMTPKRLEFENGVCKFMCYRDTGLYEVPEWHKDEAFKKEFGPKLIDGKFKYLFTAGNVWSKIQYGKGYFEMRFRTTDSYGMWPAFWMYGNNQKDEIDFFEFKGERNDQIHIDTHCPGNCDKNYKSTNLIGKNFGGWIKATENLKDGFNILAGEWQDGYVAWYLNGEGIGYFKGDFASQQMSLIIGTGPAKDGFGFAPGVNKTSVFPNSLDVDYVRVWYKDPRDKGEIKGEKHKRFSVSGKEDPKAKLKRKIKYMYDKKYFSNDLLTISLLPSEEKKFLLTSLGKEINYQFSIFDLSGKQLFSQAITSAFQEIDLSGVNEKKIKVKITGPFKETEDLIDLFQ